MYKPLVISYAYLLEKNSVGQIQRVFFEYLKKHGFSPTIVCAKSYHNDVDVSKLTCKLIPVRCIQIIRYFIAFLKRKVAEEYAYLPDYSYFSWALPNAIRRAKKEALSGKYDYIHSTCITFSSHVVALEAKKASGLPWVAFFYDPWYENPYRPIKSSKFKERDRLMEQQVAENADIIVHTNYAIYNEWVKRYGEKIKSKLRVLPLVFNSNIERNCIVKESEKKYIISHIGSLYQIRNSVDFLKALNLMLDKHPEMKDRIKLNYVGKVTPEDKYAVDEFKLSSITYFRGFLSEKECIPYFEEADLFLAIDAKNASTIFFPSKIMKYFFYQKPILGLTPENSALDYELKESLNYSFRNEDYKGISECLYMLISNNNSISLNNNEYWKKFTMEHISVEYKKIVEEILTK